MSQRPAAEEALFNTRRGTSSSLFAVALQIGMVVTLLSLAKLRGPQYARALTQTMVEFSAPPPRRGETPPPPPPLPPPPPRPAARPRPRIVTHAPQPAPAPTPVVPQRVSEAPRVLTAGQGRDRAPSGNNDDFHGGATQQGAHGNAPETTNVPAPAPTPPARGPIQLPEDGSPPEPLDSNMTPEYPAEARAQGIEATVIATVVINEQGRVTRVVIRRGHPLFDDVVRQTLMSWRYTPARVAGENVEVYWNVRVPFRLEAR